MLEGKVEMRHNFRRNLFRKRDMTVVTQVLGGLRSLMWMVGHPKICGAGGHCHHKGWKDMEGNSVPRAQKPGLLGGGCPAGPGTAMGTGPLEVPLRGWRG